MRITNCLMGGALILAACAARADILAISPAAFASGEYISYATPGVTISTMTLVPVGPGPNGNQTTFGVELSPVYAVGDTFSATPAGALGEEWGSNSSYVAPSYDGLWGGNCLQGCIAQSNTSVQWLEVNFSSPVNYVNILQFNNEFNDNEVAAFDSNGQLVGDCSGDIGAESPTFTYPCISVDPSQYNSYGAPDFDLWTHNTIQNSTDDISTLLVAGAITAPSAIGTIVYGTVSEPTTLGLLSLGLVVLALSQRCKFCRACWQHASQR